MLEHDAVLGDRYRLVRRLGEGSAGAVWEADDVRADRRVAVKVLHAALASNPEVRSRFVAEARASRRIAHRNVVEVFDDGEARDGVPYMAMELCDGETLDAVVQLRGAVGPSYACELVGQVLAALVAAHALGIVHRDLKPANIMVVHPSPSQPFVKVLDFGIAKGVHPDSEYDERGRIFGTPTYMAPEQASGGEVDARTDVYAAGTILYELLTGRPPFVGDLPSIVLAEVLSRPPMPMRAFDRSIPIDLERIVRATLAKDPADRPQSAAELRAALEPWIPAPRAAAPSLPDLQSERPLPLIATTGERAPDVVEMPRTARLVLSDSVPPPGEVASAPLEVLSTGEFEAISVPEHPLPTAPKPARPLPPRPRPRVVAPVPPSDADADAPPTSRRLMLVSDSSVPPPPGEDAEPT